ncbi:hypothetical protein Q3G72_010956 [Acer saccharum]|nr:hypothetical protein Q3G72_010956 [Acer saccharum]
MALATRQLQSNLSSSSPTYTKFDKKSTARSNGGDAPEDDRGLGWFIQFLEHGLWWLSHPLASMMMDEEDLGFDDDG